MFYFLRLSLSLRKSQVFLYYGYELVQLVSNVRMNRDVKDGSGRKWHFLCGVSFCAQLLPLFLFTGVFVEELAPEGPWEDTQKVSQSHSLYWMAANLFGFLSQSPFSFDVTLAHVIHRHVGIQSWKCSIHRFMNTGSYKHVKINGFLTSAKLPTFLFSSLQLEDGVYRVKSVFSLLWLILHEKHAQ